MATATGERDADGTHCTSLMPETPAVAECTQGACRQCQHLTLQVEGRPSLNGALQLTGAPPHWWHATLDLALVRMSGSATASTIWTFVTAPRGETGYRQLLQAPWLGFIVNSAAAPEGIAGHWALQDRTGGMDFVTVRLTCGRAASDTTQQRVNVTLWTDDDNSSSNLTRARAN